MNHQKRNECIQKHFSEILKIASSQGIEYSNSTEDANRNFYKLGEELGLDPKQVLWVYAQKHNQSISQYIRTGETQSNETIQSRIYDAILYHFILLSLIEDENSKK